MAFCLVDKNRRATTESMKRIHNSNAEPIDSKHKFVPYITLERGYGVRVRLQSAMPNLRNCRTVCICLSPLKSSSFKGWSDGTNAQQ